MMGVDILIAHLLGHIRTLTLRPVLRVPTFHQEFCHKRTTSAASTAAPEGPEVRPL